MEYLDTTKINHVTSTSRDNGSVQLKCEKCVVICMLHRWMGSGLWNETRINFYSVHEHKEEE